MATGDNYIRFKITSDGKVLPAPDHTIQSTSHEMKEKMRRILDEIAPQVARHIEKLIKERLEKGG